MTEGDVYLHEGTMNVFGSMGDFTLQETPIFRNMLNAFNERQQPVRYVTPTIEYGPGGGYTVSQVVAAILLNAYLRGANKEW